MQFELLVAGGLVVTPAGPVEMDIAVADGRIGALAAPGQLDGSAARDIMSAANMIVVPGGIDPHVHCNFEVPSVEKGEPPSYTAPPSHVSKAALWGGTTTLIDFAWGNAGEPLSNRLDRYAEEWADSYCDYSYHIVLQGALDQARLKEIPAAIDAGFPSFKIYTTNVLPALDFRVPFGSIHDLFEVTAASNGIVAVHAEDDELVMHMYDKLVAEGKTDLRYMSAVHSSLSEDLSFRRVIRLAEHVPGAALYMVHVSAAHGVQAVADARARGLPIYGETLHQYALHTQDDYLEPDGMKYHTYPSLKSHEDTEALWRGVAKRDIATFATDELCTTYAVKTAGRRIDNVTGGNTGVEPRMAIVFTEAVNRQKLGLQRFVEVTSTNAARIMGLYPQKGVIAVGSDADLTIIDPNAARTIHAADLHESDYTPWEGWRVDAWPVVTIQRGRVVVQNGEFTGTPGDGRLVIRHLNPDVRGGRAV
jgi:dihydropyrimidinase